ncbi:hypothetical protein [Candidatus Uabimicrobium amorphum]|uniref:Uncharacterized protein n=1 Tax=Uabimicrobium amorphum TaxID=2596890 RepID=A0A5S9IPN4_UABAM|nr:hypothetical protein [Candidatus Uabimicrobium amorphum]BBM85793.1 hypothetical protein UABAM_04171 [Candidatus Uabimicrobium amorphum]
MKNLPLLIIVGVIVVGGASLFISQSKATQIVDDLFSDKPSGAILRLALLSDHEQLAVTGFLLQRFEDHYHEYTSLRLTLQIRKKNKIKNLEKLQNELWQKELECTGILAIIKKYIETPRRIEYAERFIGLLSDKKYRGIASDILKQLPEKETAAYIYEAYKNGIIRVDAAFYATNSHQVKAKILKRHVDREKFGAKEVVDDLRSSGHHLYLQALPHYTTSEKGKIFAVLRQIPFSEIGPHEATLPALAHTAKPDEIPYILTLLEKAIEGDPQDYSDDIMRTAAILKDKAKPLSKKLQAKIKEILAGDSWDTYSVELAMALLHIVPDDPQAIEVVAGAKSPELLDDLQQVFLKIVDQNKLLTALEKAFKKRKSFANEHFKKLMIEKQSQVYFDHLMANISTPDHPKPYILNSSLWEISKFANKRKEVVAKFITILQSDKYQDSDKRTIVYILGKEMAPNSSSAISIIKELKEKHQDNAQLLMAEFCDYALQNIEEVRK